MTLNERLIEWRKGYFYWLKTAYKVSEFFLGVKDSAVEFFTYLCTFVFSIILVITFPLWFFSLTFLHYKLEYKRLKKRFADCHIDLTENYQPGELKNEKDRP